MLPAIVRFKMSAISKEFVRSIWSGSGRTQYEVGEDLIEVVKGLEPSEYTRDHVVSMKMPAELADLLRNMAVDKKVQGKGVTQTSILLAAMVKLNEQYQEKSK